MKYSLIYFHRLHFPSESGQTLQVLRDYHAMAVLGESAHLFYRADQPLDPDALNLAMEQCAVRPVPGLSIHRVLDGKWGGRKALTRAVDDLIATNGNSHATILIARTINHAAAAMAIRARRPSGSVRVCLELHETALPHMVYQEQGRWWRAAWSKWSERRVFQRVDGLIGTVRSQVPVLDRVFPGHAPVAMLPNGVMLEAFDGMPLVREAQVGTFRLRYAGQLTSWKNPGVMIEALPHLPARVVLEIAGGKPSREEETRRELMALADRVGVTGRVEYLGYLPPKLVPRFLVGADALLLPLGENVRSRFFTCPMKLFEYAASGIPMVVTRQPSTMSLIEDGVQALMVEPNSATDLARAIRRLLEDKPLRAHVAGNARKWVTQHSYEQRALKYREFLDQLSGVGR